MTYPTDQRHGTARAASATWAWVLAICTLGYMLPWAVAAQRGARNSAQVFWVNLLTGWTLVGWVVALGMALRVHQPVPAAYAPAPYAPVGAYPAGPPAPSAAAQPTSQWSTGPDGQLHFTPTPEPVTVSRNPLASNSAVNNRLRNNPTVMKILPVAVVASFAFLIVAIAMPGDKDPAAASPSKPSSSSSSTTTVPTEGLPSRPAPVQPVAEEPEEPAAPTMTAAQSNAVRTAESYLEYTAFSRKGLIHQLKFEGFSTADATYGVDHVEVSWRTQAAKTAENYLEYSAFSRSGLIHQLEFEGFTPAQAAYGVSAAGL